MTYSIDYRRRVVSFIEEGGSQREAQSLFKISRNTLYRWLNSDDLTPKVHGLRQRKLDRALLKEHVQKYPDAKLSERAVHFGVRPSAIWYSLRTMKIVNKSA
jgi:transposase